MQITITARHLKLTPAISDYVRKKLLKAQRYFDHLIWTQVILDVEKTRHKAEIIIHASGKTLTAKEESGDLYAAIDLASDKIDQQLKRYKDKLRMHRGERAAVKRAGWSGTLPEDGVLPLDHPVSHIRTLRLVPLTLHEAINSMEQSDSAHWIFLNRDNQRVTVVYRKPDKTYGVIEALQN